jgi:hypothetical protein
VEPATDPLLAAVMGCERWQATGLIRVRAMLQMTLPDQAMFMFGDFVPGKGTAAVLNVLTFLERRHALDKSAERKETRKADHEALAIIEEAGTTKETLKELQSMVDTAQSVTTPEAAGSAGEAKRTETLRKIHVWVTAWSEMARIVITRRDQLIRLGIAKRRSQRAAAPVVTPAPVAPVPVTPPAAVVNDEAPGSRAA